MKTVLRQLLSSYQLGLKMTSPLYLKVEILILLEQEFQHVCQSTMPERPGCLPDPIIHCLGPFWLHQDFRLFRKIHSCSTPAQKVASLHFTTLCSKPFSLCFSLVQILTSPSVYFFFFFFLSCSNPWLILIMCPYFVSIFPQNLSPGFSFQFLASQLWGSITSSLTFLEQKFL